MSEVASDNQKKPSVINKKKLSLIIVLTVLILCVAFLFAYAGSYDKTYPNTYVDGVSVSGLSYEELLIKCEEISSAYSLPEKINFSAKGNLLSVPSEEIDIAFSPEKTAKSAFGNRDEQGFFQKASAFMKSFFGENQVSTGVSYNKKGLDSLISDFAKDYEKEPSNATYEAKDGKLILKNEHNGITVNRAVIEEKLGQYLKTRPKDAIELTFSASRGEPFNLETLYKELSAPPKDAYYGRDDEGEIIIVPDKPQVSINKDVLKQALAEKEEEISVDAEIVPAKVTKEDLEKALFSGTMGSWTSYFTASNYSRSANVALSASRIDGVILLPGETFSYDKTVGPRTSENGFKVAGVYINNKVEQGLGGGVCQTSSTLYSAVLYANLEIVERVSHSLPVSYMPPGQDATIAEGAIDFVFKNNTDHPIKISATIRGGSIKCDIIGTPVEGQKVVISNTTTKVFEPSTEVEEDETVPVGYKKTTAGAKGYAVSSVRIVYQDNKEVARESLTKSLYHATPNIISVNPSDKNTPPENLMEFSTSASTVPSEEETEEDIQTEELPPEEEKEIVEV